MKVFVDLDHTLCFPDESFGSSKLKYVHAVPNQKIIDEVNRLYETHEITIYTARRMVTHDGNISDVINDIGDITTKWLLDNGINYHHLIFGKPYYDILIDDKTFNPMDDISILNDRFPGL